MGLKANLLRIPMTEAGFNYNRNFELLPNTALLDPSRNFNLHNLGVEKRGGTTNIPGVSVTQRVMGGYDFRQTTGQQFMMYAKNNGSVYFDNDSNVIKTGMATGSFFHFSQFSDTLYISDGTTLPQKWTGSGGTSGVTPSTDWATSGYPFQIIFHARGSNFRNWAIARNGVYASKDNTGDDFADADVKFIPVYSRGGLVGAAEFGKELFVFSKTETFRIDDSSTDPTQWGYQKAIWEGGASHWRLLVPADNDLYIMTDDLNIYSMTGVFQTGDYRKASLSRPAQIDRYLRENSAFPNLDNWHGAYDPKLRCIKWFIQVGGSINNTALVQFIDRPPDKMWALHDNLNFLSGYNASCSFTFRKSPSDWRIYTGDYVGNLWQLEQANRADNGNPIPSVLKFKLWDFGNPLMHKHFPKGVFRVRSDTNMNFTNYVWINNVRIPDVVLTVTSSGAIFDTSTFDNAYFSDDTVSKTPFDIKSYGETMQLQVNHNNVNEDFFLAEIILAFKENGVRIFA